MHSQNKQDNRERPRGQHVTLSTIKSDDLSYIDDVVRVFETAISSPESAMLLSSLYDNKFGLNNIKDDNEAIGPVLYREQEDIISCTRLDDLIRTYSRFNILKFYGLTVNEFMELPAYMINSLTSSANELMIAEQEHLNKIEEEAGLLKDDIDNITNGYNNET